MIEVKRRGSLPPLTVAEIFSQVCDALDEAHRNNMVHRDIKPDNIIVNASPSGLRVKVLDFKHRQITQHLVRYD